MPAPRLAKPADAAAIAVYVARGKRGQGSGYMALAALIEATTAAGFWKLVSRIFPENTASLALAARLAFRQVGTYERHGQLDGQWRDCVTSSGGCSPAETLARLSAEPPSPTARSPQLPPSTQRFLAR